ncbi:hypothetical protein ACWDYH_06190 [Nocardia goodfellowii]
MALAPTPAKAVRYAGGWLFDRVMAGWDVTVMVSDGDIRPLEILGVRVVDLESGLAAKQRAPLPNEIAMDVDMCESDTRMLDRLLRVPDEGWADAVVLWGDRWPAELGSCPSAVHHRLSCAARAFKAQALTAAADREGLTTTVETFRTWESHPGRCEVRDLVSAP